MRAPWNLTKKECLDMKEVITKFRTPTGYMRCLRDTNRIHAKLRRKVVKQLVGLKMHDWHKMIQVINVAKSIIAS
jgi:hypothetical protein